MPTTELDAPPEAAADETELEAPPTRRRTVVAPPGQWEWVDVGELWRYRELLYFLAWRDVKVRYKQTVLGAAWAILQPALLMAVFTVFFGRLAGVPTTDTIPQPLFFLAGVVPWFFFSSAVSAASASVVGSERLVTKVYFPRLVVPFAAVGAAAVDFLVACGLLAAVAVGCATAGYAIAPGWQVLLLPLVAVLIGLTAAGVGTWLAALNVEYRDVRYVVPFFIQLGMFATPTIYMRPTGEEGGLVRFLLTANPLTSLVEAFRAGVVGGPVPWAGLGLSAVIAVVVFVSACLYFRRAEDRFADVI